MKPYPVTLCIRLLVAVFFSLSNAAAAAATLVIVVASVLLKLNVKHAAENKISAQA